MAWEGRGGGLLEKESLGGNTNTTEDELSEIVTEMKDKVITFYLRVIFISSRYLFSQACVLMARIPPTASLMVEMRWSDTSAVRRRSCALAEDNRTK